MGFAKALLLNADAVPTIHGTSDIPHYHEQTNTTCAKTLRRSSLKRFIQANDEVSRRTLLVFIAHASGESLSRVPQPSTVDPGR